MWRPWFCRDTAVVRDAPRCETFLVWRISKLALARRARGEAMADAWGDGQGNAILAATNVAGSSVCLTLPGNTLCVIPGSQLTTVFWTGYADRHGLINSQAQAERLVISTRSR